MREREIRSLKSTKVYKGFELAGLLLLSVPRILLVQYFYLPSLPSPPFAIP